MYKYLVQIKFASGNMTQYVSRWPWESFAQLRPCLLFHDDEIVAVFRIKPKPQESPVDDGGIVCTQM